MCDAQLDARSFRCEHCGQVFISDWTEEDAMAEALVNGFPEAVNDPNERSVLCSDCYEKFMTWFKSLPPERVQAMREEAGYE